MANQSLFFPLHAGFNVYKWLVVIPILVLSTIIASILVIIMSMLGMPDLASRIIGTAWGRVNMAAMLSDVSIEGADNLDRNQPYVITVNHQSLIDIYVIYGLGIDLKWVMKKELKKIPMFGFACEKMGYIIIDRSNSQASLESINSARSRILRGNSVIFFPEGTRSRDGQLLPFKKGAFRLAIELKLPILPMTIQGTREMLPTDGLDWRPGHIKLKIHDPIPTENLTTADIRALSLKTWEIINSGLHRS